MRTNKKRNIFLIFVFIFIIGFSMNSTKIAGHSPTNLTLDYGYAQQQLTVLLVHSVADANTHYIFDIKIWNNNDFVDNYLYTNQTTNSIFAYTYNVSADVGDILKVTAECNQGGSLTKQITVSDNTITPSVPAAYVCIILIGLSSTVLIKIRRRVKRQEGSFFPISLFSAIHQFFLYGKHLFSIFANILKWII